MTETQDMRAAVVEWFESDFKNSAKATTKTSRLEDGRLSYRFSVTNNSGFNFSKFSFRIKVINKADNSEIGSAVIKAGEWADGEKKNFRSKLAIPDDARSLSFVMYSNSLDFEIEAIDTVPGTVSEIGDALREVGDALSGADGSGGVFGELFGTGGMPETEGRTASNKPAANRSSGGGTARKSNSGTVNTAKKSGSTGNAARRPAAQTQTQSFTQKRTEKKLNKKRLGKSGWTVASAVIGVLFLMSAAGSTDDPEFRLAVGAIGVIALAAAGIMKLVLSTKAKRIRTYESKVNYKGNTSIDELASYVGKPFEKVADELQQMIVDGFFPGAYVDINNRMLVMTRNGEPIESVEKSVALNNKAKRKAGKDKNVRPQTLDDLITMTDDAEIKAGLRELRAVTKKIDARVEEVPELEKQVKDFREKYYPEVVRLTDEYNDKIADMGKIAGSREEVTESASGAPVINTNPNYLEEQAQEIKAQLIDLIDSVTEASENLLEKLHEEDIMDITTDIKMLQTTLANKGLLDSDFDVKL